MKRPFTMLGVVIFVVVALAHAWRLATGADVIIADETIPMWASWLGVVVAGGLAFMVWREAQK
ncbi:MAG: hypothetical protein ACT4OG_07820 [Alphaproteobacteria bacterium]